MTPPGSPSGWHSDPTARSETNHQTTNSDMRGAGGTKHEEARSRTEDGCLDSGTITPLLPSSRSPEPRSRGPHHDGSGETALLRVAGGIADGQRAETGRRGRSGAGQRRADVQVASSFGAGRMIRSEALGRTPGARVVERVEEIAKLDGFRERRSRPDRAEPSPRDCVRFMRSEAAKNVRTPAPESIGIDRLALAAMPYRQETGRGFERERSIDGTRWRSGGIRRAA